MNKLIELDAALGEYLEFKKLADESVEDIMVGKGNRSLAIESEQAYKAKRREG